MIRLTTSGYENLEDYVVAVIYEYLTDEEQDTFDNTLLDWVALTNRFSAVTTWDSRVNLFNQLFNVERPEELADIYTDYLDQIADYLIIYGVLDISNQYTEGIAPIGSGWIWDRTDPLVLDDHNKGLVVRIVLLKYLETLFVRLIDKRFIPPYELDN